MMSFLRCAIVALVLTPTFGAAQEFDAGLNAARAGDFATALREWKALAQQGDAGAQFNLGLMYGRGEGVAQDHAEAAKWWRLAAEQGNAEAQTFLGHIHESGEGVLQDYVTAHMWFNLALTNGDEKARESRNRVAGLMTADAIAEAQQRARACMSFNYQECD